MNKRGISPLIASVLLIAFTIILFATITLWIRNSAVNPAMQETENKIASDLEAMGTRIEVEDVKVIGNTKIKLTLTNIGGTDIRGFNVRVIGSNNVDVVNVEENLAELETITKEINFSLSKTGSVNRIEVVPIISSGLAISATSVKEISSSAIIDTSCLIIHQRDSNLTSGNYLIYPDGENLIQVYCDMETNGGGWMLITSSMIDSTVQVSPNTITQYTGINNGVIYEHGFVNDTGCGTNGTFPYATIIIKNDFEWSQIRAKHSVWGTAACWGFNGNSVKPSSLAPFNPLQDTLENCHNSCENVNYVMPPLTRCDNEPTNFFRYCNQCWKSFVLTSHRTNTNAGGPSYHANCNNVGSPNGVKWKVEEIYIR